MTRVPTAEQQAVIDHRESHLCLTAPPGTGKTDTMAGRIVRLLDDGVSPDLIVSLSFSRLAAHELGERVQEIRGKEEALPKPQTLHSFALSELRSNQLYSVCGDVIIDDWEMTQFFRQDVADRIGGLTGAKAYELLSAMEADWRTLRVEEAPMPHERAALEDALRALRPVFNFALLGELVYRLKRWAESETDYRPSIHELLVDEYQDLNRCEQGLIELLHSRTGATLFVAGDDDQSIYGWRQANLEGIQEFPDRFGATPFSLSECWRCGQAIIDKAWAVIEQVPGRSPDKRAPISKRSFPGEVMTVSVRSAQASAKDVAKLVKHLVDHDSDVNGPGEIMVLVPRKGFARDYEKSLQEVGVPAANLADANTILDKAGVRKMLYVLRLSLDPCDAIALRALLRLRGGIGPATMKPIIDSVICGDYSTFEMAVRASSHPRVRAALEEIDSIEVLDESLSAQTTIDRLAAELRVDVKERTEFMELAVAIMGGEDLAIADFLTALRDFRVTPQPAPKEVAEGPVRIMTLRQAKGLSSEVVIVTDLDDEIVPGGHDSEHLNEQRRLLYVSMTRAIRKLFLFYCGRRTRHASRWAGTGSQRRPQDQRTICRFLDGLGISSTTVEEQLRSAGTP